MPFAEIADYAAQAIEEAGIPLLRGKIRGGTDGSRLSFMGLLLSEFIRRRTWHTFQKRMGLRSGYA